MEFFFEPKRQKTGKVAETTREGTLALIKTLHELLHATSAHWCDVQGDNERDVEIDLVDFAPKDPERYRTSLGRSYLKFLKLEDLGAETAQDEENLQYGSGDDYDPADDDDQEQHADATGSARQPSFCFLHFAWFPSSDSFIAFFRFFRVPVHGTRAGLCHFFIESLMQRAQSLNLPVDVCVAPKAMRNLSLAVPTSADPLNAEGFTKDDIQPLSPRTSFVPDSPRRGLRATSLARNSSAVSDARMRPQESFSASPLRGAPPILKINRKKRPHSDGALRSYLCKVTWLWTFPSVHGAGELLTQASINVAKCTRAVLLNWRANGFRDTLQTGKTLLRKEILCKHDPLEVNDESESQWSHWQQWQHWFIEGKVRSVVQYRASHVRAEGDNAIKVELWVDPLSIQRQQYAMVDCYRLTVHTGERRDPQMANFYKWQSAANDDMATGGTRAVFEQMQALDEEVFARFHSFDRVRQLCETGQDSLQNNCSVCGRVEKRIIFTLYGARLCSQCSAMHRVECISPPHDLISPKSVSASSKWHDHADTQGDARWNSKVFMMTVPFRISSLLGGETVDRWKPRQFDAPSGGSWSLSTRGKLPTDTFTSTSGGSPRALQAFYDDMANALKSVSDFEMHLLPTDCAWLAEHEGMTSAVQCFVSHAGYHRVLLSMVTCNSSGVLVSTFCVHQPQTEMEADESSDTGIMESWKDRDDVCFRGDCVFCRAEGYEQAGEKNSDGLKSTWYADLLGFLYQRVFTVTVKERLTAPNTPLGVSGVDMQKSLHSCLEFRAEISFPRLTTASLSIDMDHVHDLVGEDLVKNGTSAAAREAACQLIHCYERPRLNRPSEENPEPQIASYYIADKATPTERSLVDAIVGQNLCPLGPHAENLFLLTGFNSGGTDEPVSAKALSSFDERNPAEHDRFMEPCLCAPEVAQAAGQYDAQMSTWLRRFAHDLEGAHKSPMFAYIGMRDVCNACSGEGTVEAQDQDSSECAVCRGQGYLKGSAAQVDGASRCVMQIRFYTLLPIVASHGGTRTAVYTTFDDDERIKSALPNDQKTLMKDMYEAFDAIASAVLLENMPVHFTNTETASLVSGAMQALIDTPHHLAKHNFLTRDYRLQFVDSPKVRSRVAEELRSTNLLRLKEVKDGTFMLLQRPTVRRVHSKRVYEPSVSESDQRDELIPGAYEQNAATELPSPFWCLIETSFDKSSVFVTSFSTVLTAAQQEQMLEDIDATLMCLSQRANVSVLLSELSETKRCHRLLYDPDPIAGKISAIREHCAELLIAEARREAAKFNTRGTSSATGASSGRKGLTITGGSKRKPIPDPGTDDASKAVAAAATKDVNRGRVASDERGAGVVLPPTPTEKASIADASARRPTELLKALREKLKNLNQQGGALRADMSKGARPQSERLPELETKPRGPTTKEQTVRDERKKMLDALQTKLEVERDWVLTEIAEAAGLTLPDAVDGFDESIADVNYGAGAPVNGRWQVDRLTGEGTASKYTFPLLHTVALRVNERVDPKQALEVLEEELADLKITNRSAFVYKSDNAVFYLRLLLRDIPEGDKTEAKGQDAVTIPTIFLAIYGIDTPSPEVRKELNRRLLNRLEKVALNALSARLRKNLRFKLSPADVTFVCGTLDPNGQPFLQQPSRTVAFPLPLEVSEPDILLSFMKQNLEQTKLVHKLYFGGEYDQEKHASPVDAPGPLRSPEGSRREACRKGSRSDPSPTSSPRGPRGPPSPTSTIHADTDDATHPLDLLLPRRDKSEGVALLSDAQQDSKHIELYYNYKKEDGEIVNMSRATLAQKNLEQTGRRYGEGVAFIFMSIVPGESDFGSDTPSISFDAPEPLWPTDDSGSDSSLEYELNAKRVVIRLWTKGSVKTAQLMTYIKVGVHQALHEYCLDVVCLQSLRFQKGRLNLSFVGAGFRRALVKEAPSVSYVEVDAALPWTNTLAPWCYRPFVNEVLAMVETLEYGDIHICLEAEDGLFVPHSDLKSESFQKAVKQLPFERALAVLGIETQMKGLARSVTFYPVQRDSAGSMLRGDSFCLVICRGRVWAYTYNWSKKRTLDLHEKMSRVAYWMCHRCSLLGRILAAKMGLEPVGSSLDAEASLSATMRDAEQSKSWEKGTRTYSVEMQNSGSRSAFLTGQETHSLSVWKDERKPIYSATDVPIGPLSVSECADQALWLKQVLSSSSKSAAPLYISAWPWLRLQVPPTLEMVLKQMLPPGLSEETGALVKPTASVNQLAYASGITVGPPPKVGGASRRILVPRLDIGDIVVRGSMQTSQRKPALPTFSQIDWYHGPNLSRATSTEMLSEIDHLEFESAREVFLGDYPPAEVGPEEEAAAGDNKEVEAPRAFPAKQQMGLVFSESKPNKLEPFARAVESQRANPFGQLQTSPSAGRAAGMRGDGFVPTNPMPPQVRQRGFSLDVEAPSTRVRSGTESIRPESTRESQSDVLAEPHCADGVHLTALLSDEVMQRHLVRADVSTAKPSDDETVDGALLRVHDLLMEHGGQLQNAATDGRLEMRRHLHQAQMLRTLQSDGLEALGLAPAAEISEEDRSSASTDAEPQLTRGNPAVSSSVDPDELEFTLANSARLLHACRWPLLFNEACSLLGESSVSWDEFRSTEMTSSSPGSEIKDDDLQPTQEQRVLSLYRRLLESLLHFYSLYLRTVLDFELVTAIPGESMPPGGQPLPTATSSKHATIMVGSKNIALYDSPRVYLRKLVPCTDGEGDDAVIVMQLEFDGIFVCANLFAPLAWPPGGRRRPFNPGGYGVRNPYSQRSGGSNARGGGSGARTQTRNTVDDEAADVARRMCLQGFIYDYHLHYACITMLLRPPFEDAARAPFAVLPMLRMLTQHHTATTVGSAPAGAIGNLTHTRHEQIQLPLPLLGERAALPEFVEFMCADDQLLGCRRLTHPADRGLGFCVLARQPQTEWQFDAKAETAIGVEPVSEEPWYQSECYFCVVSLKLLSAGSDGSVAISFNSSAGGDGDEIQWRVVKPAVLRSGAEVDSPTVGELAKEEVIQQLEMRQLGGVTRIRCDRGWTSMVNRSGDALLQRESQGPVGATLSCEIFAGMSSDLERYYPRLGAAREEKRRVHALDGGRACAVAALAFARQVLVAGAKQYHRRLLWDKAAEERRAEEERLERLARNFSNSDGSTPSPVHLSGRFGPLGSPRHVLENVPGHKLRQWVSLCPARELSSYDVRLELLLRKETTMPWARFLSHMYQHLGCDLVVAPEAGPHQRCTVVLCHPQTPMHAVLLRLERKIPASAGEPSTLAPASSKKVLVGQTAAAYLAAIRDAMLATTASLLGQRSLAAGGGAEKLAAGVVENTVNSLILFQMDEVLSVKLN